MPSNPDILRILHVIRSLDPAAGGPPAVARQLAQAQADRGSSVGILTGSGSGREELAVFPVTVHARIGPSATFGLTAGPPEIAGRIEGADIVHLHGVWDPLLLVAARAALRAQRRYIVTPHGMLDPWCLGQSRWKKRLALAVAHRPMLDRAARLHLLNADEERLLAPLALRAPTAVIPNGIDLKAPDAAASDDAFRATRGALGGAPFILFLGRLHPKKGLDLLAEAFSLLAERFTGIRLVVAGPDGGARADFEKQIAAMGLTGRVGLVGPLYGPEKWAALRDAACFCLPSRQEGFSIAILEAMAVGRPVVITEQCHFPEVSAAGAGVIVQLHPASLAAGLTTLLAEPAAADRMGRSGRALVESHYTWDRIAAQFDDLYRDVLRRKRDDA